MHGAVIHAYRYGRKLDDFGVGEVFEHPWEVTVDDGMTALFYASFQDALPTYASRVAARAAGLRDRPIHPLLLLNLGISFSVHDVSEQAIANLGYIDVRFPEACYAGDTVRARSRVIATKPVSSPDKGVVHVRTQLLNEREELVCTFERKALVRAGSVVSSRMAASGNGNGNGNGGVAASASLTGVESGSPSGGQSGSQGTGQSGSQGTGQSGSPSVEQSGSLGRGAAFEEGEIRRMPRAMREALGRGDRLPLPRFSTVFEDFEVGDVFAHEVGRTVTEAELSQLTTLSRNSHPLHTDEVYCKHGSFAKTRVAYGGLVLAWVLSLSSRDTTGNAVWDLGLDDGAHTGSVLAGDTLFAASKVLEKEVVDAQTGLLTLRVVGCKNVPTRALLSRGASLFEPELPKTEGRVPEKVVEITRKVLVRRSA